MNESTRASQLLSFFKKYQEEVPQLVKQEDWMEVFSYHFNGGLALEDFYNNCSDSICCFC